MTPPDNPSEQSRSEPHWAFAAFRQGAADVMSFLPGLAAFSMAYGTVAARKGMTLFETLLMSATVFGGVVQMVVLDSWPETLTVGAIAGIVALTALVNARYLMIGATLRPLLGPAPAHKAYPTLFFLVEPAWLMSLRYYAKGGRDPAYLLGGGMAMYLIWVTTAIPGFIAGAAVGNPKQFGIDLVVPAFFVAMMVPLWRGARRSYGLIVGALAAALTYYLLGGVWYLIVGAVAGCIAGVFNDD
ncbi:AzlC family ABC transporter permease [Undibacter mobilis]|uniref:Branched-chain amino acid ABC transporter permease n=1 Tax=Undibacter mobilis TaxID=2292256 RepID=A0A371BB62_9BRAD|nr:AzlC family ABC transporter permease [Undibacter mobilis]RDV04790.1 branched-chain amino acid ABC transporter permease [Undibacter mobilis]